MKDAAGTLRRVIAALDAAGVQHMIVGSFASTFHGEPRATQDVDIVVQIDEQRLERFLSAFDVTEWYVDAETARRAVRGRSMFNLVDYDSGWKVDVVVAKSDDFTRSQFDRRVAATLLGVPVFVASAEDTVLSKLAWYRLGGEVSERQWRDVLGVLAVSAESLDIDYLRRWGQDLGVDDLLERALAAGA